LVSVKCQNIFGSSVFRCTLILSEWCPLGDGGQKGRYKGQDCSASGKLKRKWAEQNPKISVKVATEAAESAASDGKTFCIIQLDVGLDAAAVREALSKVMEKKMKRPTRRLYVTEWLTTALGPLKGRCGKGKSSLASGQGTDASQVNTALDLAASFASLKVN
ncbi:unnamed protein product, partial [Brassica oleracea]